MKEWTAVLRFALKWNFVPQRELALRKLAKKATMAYKIFLGQRFEECSPRVIPALREIVKRAEPISLAEGHLLAVADMVLIGQGKYRLTQKYIPEGKMNDLITERLQKQSES